MEKRKLGLGHHVSLLVHAAAGVMTAYILCASAEKIIKLGQKNTEAEQAQALPANDTANLYNTCRTNATGCAQRLVNEAPNAPYYINPLATNASGYLWLAINTARKLHKN